MNKENVVILICLVCSLQVLKAQDRKSLYWTIYFNQLSIGKWQVNSEVENIRLFSPHEQNQFLIGTIGLYKFTDKVKAGSGFTYIRLYDENKDGFVIPALRPFQQVDVKHGTETLNLEHRLRTEQRFVRDTIQQRLLDSHDFTFVNRYRIQVEYSFAKKETGHFALQLSEEVFINLSSSKETFDQNRLYAGFVFQPAKTIALGLGYMWLYQNKKSKVDENRDIIHFVFQHFIDYNAQQTSSKVANNKDVTRTFSFKTLNDCLTKTNSYGR